ncbi:MAG: hypothetical protein N4A35_05520 [Flavobacteriales bacterium]|jgi:hypothetical protein|nr:hypothetical protein [Flavobacteriales bacterium]
MKTILISFSILFLGCILQDESVEKGKINSNNETYTRINFINSIGSLTKDSSITIKGSLGTETLVYLGEITDSNSIKHFISMQKKIILANGIKGKSALIVVDEDNIENYHLYDFELPENLPLKIEGNIFVFSREKLIYSSDIEIFEGLICISSELFNECYEAF